MPSNAPWQLAAWTLLAWLSTRPLHNAHMVTLVVLIAALANPGEQQLQHEPGLGSFLGITLFEQVKVVLLLAGWFSLLALHAPQARDSVWPTEVFKLCLALNVWEAALIAWNAEDYAVACACFVVGTFSPGLVLSTSGRVCSNGPTARRILCSRVSLAERMPVHWFFRAYYVSLGTLHASCSWFTDISPWAQATCWVPLAAQEAFRVCDNIGMSTATCDRHASAAWPPSPEQLFVALRLFNLFWHVLIKVVAGHVGWNTIEYDRTSLSYWQLAYWRFVRRRQRLGVPMRNLMELIAMGACLSACAALDRVRIPGRTRRARQWIAGRATVGWEPGRSAAAAGAPHATGLTSPTSFSGDVEAEGRVHIQHLHVRGKAHARAV